MEFIGQQARANELLERLLSSSETRAFYLDLEADNFHHYEEVLCTVQICVGGDFYLLDALNLDLSQAFCEVLKTKTVWMHGCDYDLHLFNKNLDVAPSHLRDTQVAARLCGFKRFGYAPLVEQIAGIKLPKDSQRADWTRRPLSAKMITYAKDDVRYLPQLSDLLLHRLEKLGRMEWFEESCASLVEGFSNREVVTERWRISGSGNMNSEHLAYLKELYEWRDGEARQMDKPPFKVANNQQLLTWVTTLAKGEEVVLPRGMRSPRKESFTQAVLRVQNLPQESWPMRAVKERVPRVKIDDEALNALMRKRDKAAQMCNLDPSYVASRKYLEAIVKDEREVSKLMHWQRELLQL